MSKKKGIFTVALIVLFAIFIGYVDIFGFGTSKAGSAKDIKLGLDLAGGVSITYNSAWTNGSFSSVLDNNVALLAPYRLEGVF